MNQNGIPKDIKQIKDKAERKEIYKKVVSGEIHHKQLETAKKNLIPLSERTEEEQKAIRRKGWEKMMEIKGERKTAKESLEQFLPLFANNVASDENIPQDVRDLIRDNKEVKVTQYDLIMLSMINQARNGNIKAAEFIANHYGDVVVKESHHINEVVSASDKALIEKISQRLNIIDIKEDN